jgi:glycosyltransferase involved in cell wall biosynthesis
VTKIIFIVSAYNEEKNLKKVLLSLKKYGKSLTIDDGSIDNTKKIAKKYSDYYLNNKTNKGYDFTQKKGLIYAVKKLKSFKYAITFDGDGQHIAREVDKFKKKLKYSIIIGNRKFYNRPIEKKISFISKKKFDISDPLTGMKMFNIKRLKKEILKLNFKKNDFGLYFLRWIKDFTYSNVTINVKKQNKKSSMGESKNVQNEFYKSFKKVTAEILKVVK